MTFITAVAGPSRIPATAVSAAVPASRRAFARCGRSTATRQYASSAPGTSEEGADGRSEREIRLAERKDKAFWSGPDGYKRFLKQTAAQFEAPAPGNKARWLGGSVPYASNPSFKPPPPLSNDFQNVLYAAVQRGDRTVGQIAERFNVSKARIEAVRKLKEVEDEYKRQSVPLQRAYLQAMEPLLGVQSLTVKDNRLSERHERELLQERQSDQSNHIERIEEARHDLGVGEGGAFGNRVQQEKQEGIERTVWEFRDEQATVEARAEQARPEQSSVEPAPDSSSRSAATDPTPSRLADPAGSASASVPLGKSSIRFVDTSKDPQSWGEVPRSRRKSSRSKQEKNVEHA